MLRLLRRDPASGFRLTALGKRLLLLVLVVGAGALNTGVNLLYLVFSLLVGALIASAILSILTLRGLEASLLLPGQVCAKERFFGAVKLTNPKRQVAGYSVWVREPTYNLLGTGTYFFSVPPAQDISQGFCHAFQKRGLVAIECLCVFTRFPFGLFEKRFRAKTDDRLLVYPRIYPVSKEQIALLGGQGQQEIDRKGSGNEIYSIRKYAAGDPFKRIHWKSTARLSTLMVKQAAAEEEGGVGLLFDNLVPGPPGMTPAVFEAGVSAVASVAAMLLRSGISLDFASLSHFEKDCQGEHGLLRILRVLALIEPVSPTGGAKPLRAPGHLSGKSGMLVLGFADRVTAGNHRYMDVIELAKALRIEADES